METITAGVLAGLNPDEAEAFANGTLTKKQVLKRAQNRRYHERHGRKFGPVKAAETITVQLKTPEPSKAERKKLYLKAWRAKNRAKLAEQARARYHADKNVAAKGNAESREARRKRLKVEYQREWRAKNRAAVNAAKRAAYAKANPAVKPSLEARVDALEGRLERRSLLQRIVGNLFRI